MAQAEDIPPEFLLLVTEDDMQIAEELLHPPISTIGTLSTEGRSPMAIGEIPKQFAANALRDVCGDHYIINDNAWSDKLIEDCKRHQAKTIVTSYAPVGRYLLQF